MNHLPIVWSQEAIKNIQEIIFYIRCDSIQNALAFANKITKSVQRLGLFPESGKKVPELSDQLPLAREILVGEYRVIYRITEKKVEIVTILHGKRLFPLPY